MGEELKPCPFCGGEAMEDSRGVGCGSCDVFVDLESHFLTEGDRSHWNTRPLESTLREQLNHKFYSRRKLESDNMKQKELLGLWLDRHKRGCDLVELEALLWGTEEALK